MTSKFEVARSQTSQRVPDEASIKKIFEIVAVMPDDVDYAQHGFQELFQRARLANDKVITQISDFTKLVQGYRDKATDHQWQGKPIDAQFNVFVDVLAEQTASALAIQQHNESINVEFAMSNASEFRRGYSVGEDFKEPDQAVTEKMDILFIAWLKNNNFVSKDGFIYEGQGKDIKLNSAGEPVHANAAEFQRKFTDPNTGFGAKAKEAGLNVSVLPRAFPEEGAHPTQG